MRFEKDSIQLNELHDMPLLRQVLHCEFVSRSQLFKLLNLSHHEQDQDSFNWRVRRLLKHEYLLKHKSPMGRGEVVYSAAKNAVMLAQATGEHCLDGDRVSVQTRFQSRILHSLGINDIHLGFLRTDLFVRWIYATEIRSQNELTDFGYAKDYDAVVTIRSAGTDHRVALEYERSPKTAAYYTALAETLGRESRVTHVLYLMSNSDLLRYVSRFFSKSRASVRFGLVNDWLANLFEMRVFDPGTASFDELRSAFITVARSGDKTEAQERLRFDL